VRPLRLHLSGTQVRACRKVAVPRPPALSPHHTHVECTLWECGNSRAWRGSKPSVTRLFTPAGKRVRQAAPLPGHWRRAGAKSKVGSPQFREARKAGKRDRQAAPLPGHWRRAGAKSKVGSPQFVVFAIVESTSQPLHAPSVESPNSLRDDQEVHRLLRPGQARRPHLYAQHEPQSRVPNHPL